MHNQNYKGLEKCITIAPVEHSVPQILTERNTEKAATDPTLRPFNRDQSAVGIACGLCIHSLSLGVSGSNPTLLSGTLKHVINVMLAFTVRDCTGVPLLSGVYVMNSSHFFFCSREALRLFVYATEETVSPTYSLFLLSFRICSMISCKTFAQLSVVASLGWPVSSGIVKLSRLL